MPTYHCKFDIYIPRRVDYCLAVPLLLARCAWYGYPFRRIPLTRGKYAIVDAEDYPRLMKYKWYANKIGSNWYAVRSQRIHGSKRQITIFMHRLILNAPDDMLVDHKNGNGLDNRKANLRLATYPQNNCNRRKCSGKCVSIYKGVYAKKRRSPWGARIKVDGKYIHLGSYKTEIEAAKAYDEAARKYHGEFARLNFPEER